MSRFLASSLPRFLASSLIAASLACSDTPMMEAPVPASPQATSGSMRAEYGLGRAAEILAQPDRFPRGIEDDILQLETALPGLGGLYVDERGDLVAISVGVVPDGSVRERVSQYVTESAGRFARPDGSPPRIIVKRGNYAFSQLLDFLAKARPLLSIEDDIVFLDADEQQNRLRLGVGPKGSAVRAFDLARRAGIDTAALYIEPVPEYPRTAFNSLRDKWRATFAGIQTQAGNSLCSMGFHVTDSIGTRYFLTASHCTGNFNGSSARVFYQPTASASNRVGVESVNPAWSTTGCLPGASYCRLADVALVTFDSPSLLSKVVAQSSSVGSGNGTGNLTIGAIFSVGTQGDAASGTTVYRTGRTTGSTMGAIVGTCVDVGLIYDSSLNAYVEVFCGSEVAARADGGDSGGPIYHWRVPLASSARQADGILYAGGFVGSSNRYWYSSWTQIESTLARTLTAH